MIADHFFPLTIQQALNLKEQFGEQACFMAGGTDLLLQLEEKRGNLYYLIDLTRIPELSTKEEIRNNHLHLSACLTVAHIAQSSLVKKHVPSLFAAAAQLGSPAVRNQGTLGGNLANASPAADLAPPLIAHGAVVNSVSLQGERFFPVEELASDVNRTILNSREILTRISVPLLRPGEGSLYLKLGLREAMTISVATVCTWWKRKKGEKYLESVRIAMGSVAPRVIRAAQAEVFLQGKIYHRETLAKAVSLAAMESDPITDIRATREYRKAMVKELVKTGLEAAWRIPPGPRKKPSANP